MTVTNSHAELPERDWTEHFPESPPDFRDGPDFRESIAPFIAEPETYDSLFTDGRAEARGGINFRLVRGGWLTYWGFGEDETWDPVTNALAARWTWERSGWGPWSCKPASGG